MSHFILVHGFNDKSAGKNSIDKARAGLEALGHTVDCDSADYSTIGLLAIRFGRHNHITRIVKAIRLAVIQGKEVVVVGYSNGCNYGLKALNLVLFFNLKIKFIAVHPALPVRFKLPPCVSRCWVCYTRSDWVVRLASYFRWLVPGWGRAGAVGYKGSDPRVINIDYSDMAVGHGGLWKGEQLDAFVGDLDWFASFD